MESLNGSTWDVVICGTDLPQSLLALALSRSGKKILHVDRNRYYGGQEAALSLVEADTWAQAHADTSLPSVSSPFGHATITRGQESAAKLGQSRAYSLALAPQLLYSRSDLLSTLVSSQTHSQLEFQAVGSWFIADQSPTGSASQARLTRVPGGREDVFQDGALDLRAKRALMKFLRFVVQHEESSDEWEGARDTTFASFLEQKFALPKTSHAPLFALTMSTQRMEDTTVAFALPRIARHLRSIGVFGPGFPAVLPKWGGLSEVAQVACRAGAVGGGVYVLGTAAIQVEATADAALRVELSDGDKVTTSWLAGTIPQLPSGSTVEEIAVGHPSSRSTTIVSSSLSSLFPPTAEGGVTPAGAVVLLPSQDQTEPPVYILVHSSESGECPAGQCVLYASVATECHTGFDRLDQAVTTLLDGVGEQLPPQQLWSMRYEQRLPSGKESGPTHDQILTLKTLSAELALEDDVLRDVKSAWQRITKADPESFMKFEAREGTMDEDE